jgi:hypothetical protein
MRALKLPVALGAVEQGMERKDDNYFFRNFDIL